MTKLTHPIALLRGNWLLLVFCLAGALLIGCGDDGGGDDNDEEPEPTDPISVTADKRAVGIFPGDSMTIGARGPEILEGIDWAVLRLQLQDELLVSREGPSAIPDAMFSEFVSTVAGELGTNLPLNKTVLVLDLMRLTTGETAGSEDPYLVRWDDNDRPPERYGFWREDYRQAVLDEATAGVDAINPGYFVFGAEMDRYLAVDGGMDDYANFVTLYREAYTAIKEVAPATRVGAGVDWVRFQLDIVPTMVLGPHEIPDNAGLDSEVLEVRCNAIPAEGEQQVLERACTDKAFRRFIEPLLRYPSPNQPENPEAETVYVTTADFIALSAQPTEADFENTPANVPDDFFGYLRRWSQRMPVVYYNVNWAVGSTVGFAKQNEWYSTLVERNNGVTVDMVAWRYLKDLGDNDCNKLVNDLGAPRSMCFAGLVAVSTAPKDVHESFVTDITP